MCRPIYIVMVLRVYQGLDNNLFQADAIICKA